MISFRTCRRDGGRDTRHKEYFRQSVAAAIRSGGALQYKDGDEDEEEEI